MKKRLLELINSLNDKQLHQIERLLLKQIDEHTVIVSLDKETRDKIDEILNY